MPSASPKKMTRAEYIKATHKNLLMNNPTSQIIMDGYFDPKEWRVKLRSRPVLLNPEEAKEGAKPEIGHEFYYEYRQWMVGGTVIEI